MINYTPPTKHTSLFYNSEEEYLDIVVPYLKAGLENNEFVAWVIPEAMEIKEAESYLRDSVGDLDYYIKKEQIAIKDYKSVYFEDGIFTATKIMEKIAILEKQALKKGFKGIRVTGDGTWALRYYWVNFLIYEKDLNIFIDQSKIRALCAYSMSKLDLKKIHDIGMNHQSSLVKQMDNWSRLEPEEFQKSNIC